MAPHPGLEPGTYRLTAGRSTKRAREANGMASQKQTCVLGQVDFLREGTVRYQLCAFASNFR